MATQTQIAPRVTVAGQAYSIDNFRTRTRTNEETGEITGNDPVARVVVLTEGGGFVTVFVPSDLLKVVPSETPSPVDWVCEISARTDLRKKADGSWFKGDALLQARLIADRSATKAA